MSYNTYAYCLLQHSFNSFDTPSSLRRFLHHKKGFIDNRLRDPFENENETRRRRDYEKPLLGLYIQKKGNRVALYKGLYTSSRGHAGGGGRYKIDS